MPEGAGILRNQRCDNTGEVRVGLPSPELKQLNATDSDWDDRARRKHYEENYHLLNPFDFESMSSGMVYAWDDFIARDTFLASEFYSGFCQPLGYE